jgi:hypothetical protein
MADYDKFDARVDSLVMENITSWDPSLATLPEGDKKYLAAALHASPRLATKIAYNRTHTGFSREITVTSADVERLYQQKLSH